ncbi:hypothetical protein CYLTODRAFT_488987 [Cylindrobasidium torrendii FP15055 ss-10]|uniref:Uncharacterized protein n=1 Tax=Cylindrobasidium torrendii FP15055 ss-10 TaxID=1314674 RepID=A0A0D7BFV6_9AGAR|nr:hypothetical protein CYLTODRAFT_488987 [Cylindrobasidium torrendii FP15055 ss-10]
MYPIVHTLPNSGDRLQAWISASSSSKTTPLECKGLRTYSIRGGTTMSINVGKDATEYVKRGDCRLFVRFIPRVRTTLEPKEGLVIKYYRTSRGTPRRNWYKGTRSFDTSNPITQNLRTRFTPFEIKPSSALWAMVYRVDTTALAMALDDLENLDHSAYIDQFDPLHSAEKCKPIASFKFQLGLGADTDDDDAASDNNKDIQDVDANAADTSPRRSKRKRSSLQAEEALLQKATAVGVNEDDSEEENGPLPSKQTRMRSETSVPPPTIVDSTPSDISAEELQCEYERIRRWKKVLEKKEAAICRVMEAQRALSEAQRELEML